MSVFVTVEIGDESYCLTVTDTNWQIIKAGAPFGDTLKASYEGEFFSYHFSFNFSYNGELIVDYSGEDDTDLGSGFAGSLQDALITFDDDSIY